MTQNKKAPAKHKAEDEYLLTTKLYCGECGCFMVGESGTGRNMVHRYYKCVSVKHHRGCHKKSIKKDWIENFVLTEIKKIYFDDELVEKIAEEAIKLQEKDNTVLPILQKQYAETEKSIKNMLIAIEQGIITEGLNGSDFTDFGASKIRDGLLPIPYFCFGGGSRTGRRRSRKQHTVGLCMSNCAV